MHDAFEPVPILEKLPLQIDCLAAWGESEDRGAAAGGSAGAARTFLKPGKRTGVWLCGLRSEAVPKGTGMKECRAL